MSEDTPTYTTSTVHKNVIGSHIQEPVPRWPDAVALQGSGSPACFFQVENITEAKNANPNIFAFHRYYVAHQGAFIDAADKHQAARVFFDRFVDGTFMTHSYNVDAICELNEYGASSDSPEEVANKTAWTRAVAEVWANEYRTRHGLEHIRLILNRAPVGNDIPFPVGEIATTNDCLVAYHPYIPVRDGVILGSDGLAPPEWPNYSGRWVSMDNAWKDAGFHVDWIFTEAGAVKYTIEGDNVHLNADDGWRHNNVFNANVDAYISCLEYWAQRVAEWNASNNNRAIGGVLFTSNFQAQWQWFRTNQPELGVIMNHFAQWTPVLPPPPINDYEIIRQAALANDLITLCPPCALSKEIEAHGLNQTSNEYGLTLSDGVWVAQNAASNDNPNVRFVYRFLVGNYDPAALVIDEVRKT